VLLAAGFVNENLKNIGKRSIVVEEQCNNVLSELLNVLFAGFNVSSVFLSQAETSEYRMHAKLNCSRNHKI
jgi:hypothetical protein